MSWLYSRALVAEYSEGNCLDGEQFAPSSESHMPQAFLPSDRMTDFLRPSRFGMTFAPLTDALGAELLMWFLAASHAKTLAQPGAATGLTARGLDFGGKWQESSARYDRDSSSWKTHQCLFPEDLPWCSVILPKCGSMRGGVCLEQMRSERRIAEIDAGLLPTPLASNTKAHHMRSGGRPARSYWPTPNAMKATSDLNFQCSGDGREKPNKLGWAVAKSFATPTVCGNYNRKGASKNSGDGLATQVGGSLNPTWVEWLMGWPLGWTDLKQLAMGKSHSVLPKHGGF